MGHPVYVPWADECRGRFAAFHGRMLEIGRTRRWRATLEPPTLWRGVVDDDTARVAARVASLLLSRSTHGTGWELTEADRLVLLSHGHTGVGGSEGRA